ncbi:hypothetical protein AFLA70_72g002951 [Aspergillus flavus AF70]|nr:hypothetical protein AFLA70_72g002951 [Aspergillus flavus AF70]
MWLIVRLLSALAYARNDKYLVTRKEKRAFVGGARRGPELTEKRNYVQYAIAATSGCFMSALLAVVAADWLELVLKDFQEDYFTTDIDQSVA